MMMDKKEITKKMIDGHRKAFATGFNSMVMLQENASKAMDSFLKQTPWVPFQTKSMINEWNSMCKKGAMDFKEAAERSYSKLEEVLTYNLETVQTKTKN
jgi:polyhydroxyalkanoate synthesis regulator phasin